MCLTFETVRQWDGATLAQPQCDQIEDLMWKKIQYFLFRTQGSVFGHMMIAWYLTVIVSFHLFIICCISLVVCFALFKQYED